MERLRADPDALPLAIEEVLRFRSPVQFMYRIAAKDVSLRARTSQLVEFRFNV